MATETTGRINDHVAAEDIALQGVLEALVDPVRRSIVRQLADAERDIACGTFDINVTRSTSAHHFKVLRRAGIIWQHYVGTVKLNSLRRADLDRAYPGLLDAVIDAARREAAAEPGRDASPAQGRRSPAVIRSSR
ncbi:helix-turn-helix transcriptional regulator [Streptomyces olivaceiscleroticus]|uniref:Helix-turn-helix domain-containing protein n=1 Tax=Streptomyces olivaceiscleroticus TaxID=68245 RepID=A0ABN1AFI8_9ACTN